MIAACGNCGFVWDSPVLGFPSGQAYFSDNKITCPNCGKYGRLLDGEFVLQRGQIIDVLSAPQFTIDLLEQLRALTERAKAGNYTPEKYKEAVEKEIPEATGILKYVTRENVRDFVLILGLILNAIMAVIAYKGLQKDQPQPAAAIYNIGKVEYNAVKVENYKAAEEKKKPFVAKQVKKTNKRSRITKGSIHCK